MLSVIVVTTLFVLFLMVAEDSLEDWQNRR
jgi:hypothetical protein